MIEGIGRRMADPLVIDKTRELYDGNGMAIDANDLMLVVVHRISLAKRGVTDGDLNGHSLVAGFVDSSMGTGGRTPYHLLVMADGTCEQMLPLSVRGSHSKGYNRKSIAVAVVGEHDQCTPAQFNKLAKVCAVLLTMNGGLRLAGHTSLHGASADAGKICPAPVVDIEELDRVVKVRLQAVPTTQAGSDWLLSENGFRV